MFSTHHALPRYQFCKLLLKKNSLGAMFWPSWISCPTRSPDNQLCGSISFPPHFLSAMEDRHGWVAKHAFWSTMYTHLDTFVNTFLYNCYIHGHVPKALSFKDMPGCRWSVSNVFISWRNIILLKCIRC